MHTTVGQGPGGIGGGQGVVSHAGLVLLRHLADKTGLTAGCRGRWRRRGSWCMTGAG